MLHGGFGKDRESLKQKEKILQHTQHEKARLQPGLFRFSVLLSVRYAKSTERKRVTFNRIDYPLVMPRAKRASKGGQTVR